MRSKQINLQNYFKIKNKNAKERKINLLYFRERKLGYFKCHLDFYFSGKYWEFMNNKMIRYYRIIVNAKKILVLFNTLTSDKE